jgi:two-component system sensor histidine kinase/response regulator
MHDKKLTVVAIDDDPGDLELLHRHLKDIPGCEVKFFAFTDPAEGIAELSCHAEDVILLDYFLGATTGLEVFKMIRQSGCKCPVIFLTGQGDGELAAELIRYGAADYLPKSSLTSSSLNRAISNAIAKYKLEEQIKEHRQKIEQMNRDLLRKNEEIQSFYHTVSHELKSPLTSAREYVSMVLDGLAGPVNDEQRKFLEISKESCDQMVVCINDLLDATRMQTGKFTINPCPVSIDKLVDRVVTSMLPTAQDKEIRLKHVIEPDLPEVFIDEKRITQVITNLLSNALKFTPGGGEIVVQINYSPKSPEFVLVSVRDTGRGIEPDKLDRIFDRLYQAKDSDSMTEGGLGLGLNICREIVKLHGGEIWVESKPGKGSTFFFTVPKHLPKKTMDTVMKKEGGHEKDSHN